MSIVLPQMRGILARGAAGATDPFFSSVQLLCHFDGTNGSTTFTDSSQNASNPGNSGPTLTTTSPLFGTACLSCVSNRVLSNNIAALAPGTGDFTAEFAYKTANPSAAYILLDWNAYLINGAAAFTIYTVTGGFRLYSTGADRITGGTVSTNTFQRVAYSRNSGTGRLFIDGTQVGSNYSDSNNYGQSTGIYLGGDSGSLTNSTSQYDEWRITIGVGRYSSNYTVDAAAFPNS